MIFSLIGLLILLYSFRNYHKAFIIYLVFKIFLVPNITLVSIPGIPLLTLDVFLTLWFVGYFFLVKRGLRICNMQFPYKQPLIFIGISWMVSAIFAYVGFFSVFSQVLRDFCQEIFIIYIMWLLINSRKDYLFLIYGLTFAFAVAGLYCYVEHFIEFNPLAQYELLLNGDTDRQVTYLEGYLDDVRGYRAQSVFEHPIGAGINFALFVFLIFSIYFKKMIRIKYLWLLVVVALICIPCVFFSASRGPFVFLVICCISFIDLSNRKFWTHLLIVFAVGLVLSPLLSSYYDIILSITDTKAQERVGGSDSEMRINQLNAAIQVMNSSPIWGLGLKYSLKFQSLYLRDLLGGESMWFTILPCFGIIGIFAYLYYAYYQIIKIPLFYKAYSLIWLSLAYWITASLTSVPGMHYHLYFLLVFLFIKMSKKYRKIQRIKTNRNKNRQNFHKKTFEIKNNNKIDGNKC